MAFSEACDAFNEPIALAIEPCDVVLCPALSAAPIPMELWLPVVPCDAAAVAPCPAAAAVEPVLPAAVP